MAPGRPAITSHDKEIQFIHHENADGLSSAASQKRVRAYAARESHARERRARIARHQESKKRHTEQHGTATTTTTTQISSLPPTQSIVVSPTRGGGPLWSNNPRTWLSAAPTDPFDSAARPLSRFEHYLLTHYLSVVAPSSYDCSPSLPNLQTYLQGVEREWVPLALTDAGLLGGLLIAACRSLYSLNGEKVYLTVALGYKMACIKSLNEDISEQGSRPRDSSIGKALILAGDEVSLGDFLTGKAHAEAALQMVSLKGGLGALGTNGFIANMIKGLTSEENLEGSRIAIYNHYSHFRSPSQC